MDSYEEWRRGRLRRYAFSFAGTFLAVGLMVLCVWARLPDIVTWILDMGVIFGSIAAVLWGERGRRKRHRRRPAPAKEAGACAACGADLRPGATYCARCGAAVPKA